MQLHPDVYFQRYGTYTFLRHVGERKDFLYNGHGLCCFKICGRASGMQLHRIVPRSGPWSLRRYRRSWSRMSGLLRGSCMRATS